RRPDRRRCRKPEVFGSEVIEIGGLRIDDGVAVRRVTVSTCSRSSVRAKIRAARSGPASVDEECRLRPAGKISGFEAAVDQTCPTDTSAGEQPGCYRQG